MRRFDVVHNIPSPYRLHLFRTLHRELSARGIGFHVHFLAREHTDRIHWRDCSDGFGFPFTYWPDLGVTVRRKQWHLNPTLLVHLLRNPPEYLLVGGAWDSLTGPLATMTVSAGKAIGWLEGSPDNPGITHGLLGRAKRHLLRRFDSIAVPGDRGRQFVRALTGVACDIPLVLLPNLVDEGLFTPYAKNLKAERLSTRRRFSIPEGRRLAIIPARLIPDKGVLEFVQAIEAASISDWHFLILGDGPLLPEIRRLLVVNRMDRWISIAPPVSYPDMPGVYRSADLFVLPSVRDRNPLSVIEALHCGLPILVSTKIGNLSEALGAGVNGWSFDPNNPGKTREAVEVAMRTSPAKLWTMGAESKRRAEKYWSSASAVSEFLDSIGAEP